MADFINRYVMYFVLLVGACLFSAAASAVGLGEIRSSTSLGDRLQAEIPINLGGQALTADEFKVSLMSIEQASRHKVDLLSSRHQFDLSIQERDGKLMVVITSPKPVTEPFINVMVHLQWPSGSLAREYTLMLDY